MSTAWQLDAYRFDIPVLAHPTDALVSPSFAIELGRRGGLGVINGEGLGGVTPTSRPSSPKSRRNGGVGRRASMAPIQKLQELHAAPMQPDLLAAAVAQVRDAGVTTAVRVSPQNARALTPKLVEAGIELLVIHGTIISAEHVVARRRAAEPEDVHRRTRRAGGRRRRAAITAPPCT